MRVRDHASLFRVILPIILELRNVHSLQINKEKAVSICGQSAIPHSIAVDTPKDAAQPI